MVSLIPKEKKKKQGFSLELILGNVQMAVAMGALLLGVVIYVGLVFYEGNLNNEVRGIVSRAEKIVEDRDIDLENEATGLAERLKSIGILLDSHVYSSKIFTAIEETTHSAASFGLFALNLSNGSISLNGIAPNYKILGEQVIAFEEDERFINVTLSNIKTEKSGQISFKVDLKILKEVWTKN